MCCRDVGETARVAAEVEAPPCRLLQQASLTPRGLPCTMHYSTIVMCRPPACLAAARSWLAALEGPPHLQAQPLPLSPATRCAPSWRSCRAWSTWCLCGPPGRPGMLCRRNGWHLARSHASSGQRVGWCSKGWRTEENMHVLGWVVHQGLAPRQASGSRQGSSHDPQPCVPHHSRVSHPTDPSQAVPHGPLAGGAAACHPPPGPCPAWSAWTSS